MKLDFRIIQEFGNPEPIDPTKAFKILKAITHQLDLILSTNKKWYEQGFSKKQASMFQVFNNGDISHDTLVRWEKEFKKKNNVWTTGIWDGEADESSAGIDLYPSYSSTGRRANPLTITIIFRVNHPLVNLNVDTITTLFFCLLTLNNSCTYLSIESGGYSFPELKINNGNYNVIYKKVFPDRISCGWMLFIPHTVLPELIPEAAKVVPVIDNGCQKGTIIVSTEDVFDGENPEHIAKANDIEIRLLDLGFLPLMTDL